MQRLDFVSFKSRITRTGISLPIGKSLRELEKLGRPANYDLLARDEKLRIDAKLRHLEAT
jgi:hypothetical protein